MPDLRSKTLAGSRYDEVFRGEATKCRATPNIWAGTTVERLLGGMKDTTTDILDEPKPCLARGRMAMIAAHLTTKCAVVYFRRLEATQLVLNVMQKGNVLRLGRTNPGGS